MEGTDNNPTPVSTAATPGDDGELQRLLADADAGERERLLRETIRTEATRVLSTSLGDDSNFLQNGLNSLTALELTKTLMTLTGIEIPMVAIVENPSPSELARHLSEEFEQASA